MGGDESLDDDPILLPEREEREWLLSALAELTAERGFSQFVVSPIVEGSEQFFPDRWVGGEASLGRLARRLLHYAGIDELPVQTEIHLPDARGGGAPAFPPRSGGVWLDGLDRKAAVFMAVSTSLREPVNAVASAARAAAQAFREHFDLVAKDPKKAEKLIDVTAVYLGFGLLVTEASLRHYSEADGSFRAKKSTFRLGVLEPQAFAYLLAAQALVRGLDKKERKRLAGQLQPNQAAFFRAAFAELEPRRAELIEQLGIPDPKTWPPPPDVDELTAPLEDEMEEEVPEERKDGDRGIVGLNEGKPVFRVERTMSGRLGKVIIMATLMGGGLVARSIKGIDLSMPHMIIGGVVLAAIGMAVGRLFEDIRCSEPKCGAALKREMKVCPRCGGDVVGVIKHAKERLAAEEALRREKIGAQAEDA